jgi:hypothetical protein
MKNIEKYGNNLKAALDAYNTEMVERVNYHLEGTPFEDWVDEDEGTTARLVEAEKRSRELAEMAVEAEKEYIRKAMPELKKFYKENGWDEADVLLTKIFEIAPNFDLYGQYASACNCFHSGMWSIVCDDFAGVWDSYCYCKAPGCCHAWNNVEEWYKQTKDLVAYIEPFITDAKEIIKDLEAKGGAK